VVVRRGDDAAALDQHGHRSAPCLLVTARGLAPRRRPPVPGTSRERSVLQARSGCTRYEGLPFVLLSAEAELDRHRLVALAVDVDALLLELGEGGLDQVAAVGAGRRGLLDAAE